LSEYRGQHVELLIKWLDDLATGRWVSFCARIVIADGGAFSQSRTALEIWVVLTRSSKILLFWPPINTSNNLRLWQAIIINAAEDGRRRQKIMGVSVLQMRQG